MNLIIPIILIIVSSLFGLPCDIYTNRSGKALYNGSVSSMAWTMGTDATTRGYRYTYDSFGRLTEAAYGEGASLSDNLHVTLDGNRVASVLEDADRVTYPGGMEYDGGKREQPMTYDNAGNLISDAGRRITSITYDINNNPRRIVFSNGGSSESVYSADGERLSVTNTTSVARAVSAMDADADADYDTDISGEDMMSLAATTVDKTEYRGMAVYKDNKPYMLLFRGGYVTFESGITFHYYTPDYLGNNRAVVNGTTGAIEQTVAYYPFGGVIADLGTGHSLQQYKFGGKELLTNNGLNEYDFGARRYYQAVPMFTQPDPFASKFPWLSPYAYCANNPVNVIDPDGKDIVVLNYGNFTKQHMAMLIQDSNGSWKYYSINGNNKYLSGHFTGGRPFNDVGVGAWRTPEEFLNSNYNQDLGDKAINDKSVNNYGFEEGYRIKSTPEQDGIMRERFRTFSESDYSLLKNNCTTIVQQVLFVADIPINNQNTEKIYGEVENLGKILLSIPDLTIIPSEAYKKIINANPNGNFVRKGINEDKK